MQHDVCILEEKYINAAAQYLKKNTLKKGSRGGMCVYQHVSTKKKLILQMINLIQGRQLLTCDVSAKLLHFCC